jgi:hypothetical protein
MFVGPGRQINPHCRLGIPDKSLSWPDWIAQAGLALRDRCFGAAAGQGKYVRRPVSRRFEPRVSPAFDRRAIKRKALRGGRFAFAKAPFAV